MSEVHITSFQMWRHNPVCVCVGPVMSGGFFLLPMRLTSLQHCVCGCVCKLENGVEGGERERERERGGYEERDSRGNKEKSKKERATAGINYWRALTDPKPTVDKEPCGKTAERKREECSSRPQGNSENLLFSESNRYKVPAPCSSVY